MTRLWNAKFLSAKEEATPILLRWFPLITKEWNDLVLEIRISAVGLCTAGGTEVREDLIKYASTRDLRREQSLHILHYEDWGSMFSNNAQVLSVEKVP